MECWSVIWSVNLFTTRCQLESVLSCCRSVVIMPFTTHDFMTGVPAAPRKDLSIDLVSTMVSEIGTVPDILSVMYDLTRKPPGTTFVLNASRGFWSQNYENVLLSFRLSCN